MDKPTAKNFMDDRNLGEWRKAVRRAEDNRLRWCSWCARAAVNREEISSILTLSTK